MKTNLPALRKARKISQEELARAVGVTRQTITSIEVGKIHGQPAPGPQNSRLLRPVY